MWGYSSGWGLEGREAVVGGAWWEGSMQACSSGKGMVGRLHAGMQALVPSQAILFLFFSIKATYDPLFTNEKIPHSDRYIHLNSASCHHKQFHAHGVSIYLGGKR